jgi:hypothetical protein
VTQEISNWIVALPMLVMGAVCLVWGGDLVATEVMAERPWWRLPLTSGAFYLGQFLFTISVSLLGLLGVFLLAKPNETTPLWFAIPMAVGAIQISLAWWFLSFKPAQEDRIDDH